MPRGKNQKMKLYHLRDIMLKKTDNEHEITLSEIKEELEKRDVTAERKSLYTDLADLKDLGVKIEGTQKNNSYYYKVTERDFELGELKMLVDAIQSSKFITEKQSRDLIKKIENFASEHEAKKLQRQVYVQGRVKTKNESTVENVDKIHTAIEENKQIKFKYLQWNINKELEERHEGEWYFISPWALTWDDENYYLVAFDNKSQEIRHYRVDKMSKIQVLKDRREGRKDFDKFDLAIYAKKNFGMFHGNEERVIVKIKNEMIGIFIDKFGKDISVFKCDKEHVEVKFNVFVSAQFLGWIFGLGEDVEIIGPKAVIEEAAEMGKRIGKQYK